MNANQLINMVVRTVIRRLVNHGVNAGINAMSSNSAGRAHPQEGRSNVSGVNQTAKQAGQVTRMARRIGRL